MEKQTCISCENKFTGNFCNNCGEKVIRREDKKLKHLLGEFINAITFADSKFWRTIKSILLKPGKFSRDFIDGKRNAYMKPISVFFFANLIYFLFPLFNTFNTTLQAQVNPVNFVHSGYAKKLVDKEIEERGISFDALAAVYDAKTSEFSKLLLIIMVLFMALLFALIHYKSGLLLVDHVTVNLELMTFVILFAVQLQGILFYLLRNQFKYLGSELINETVFGSLVLILIVYFILKMQRNFYKVGTMRGIINTLPCVLSFALALYMYRSLLFFVTFWSI